jgi:hypothetical protein
MLLIGGALLSGGLHAVSQASGVDNWNLGGLIGAPEYMNGIWYLSLLTIGVGYIAGKGGVAFIIGGYVCYWFLAPMLSGLDMFPLDPATGEITSEPNVLRLLLFRPVGIGMLIGGAIAGVALAFPMIVSAVRSMQNAAKSEAAMSRDEMPIKLLYVAIVGAAVLLAVMAVLSTEKMGLGRGLAMAAVGTLWVWIAGVILSEAIGRTKHQSRHRVRRHGGRGGLRSHVAGNRPHAGSQDRLPGRGHAQEAATGAVHRCMAWSDRCDDTDFCTERGLCTGQ